MSSRSKLFFSAWLLFVASSSILLYFLYPALLKPETNIVALLPKSDNAFADESIKSIAEESGKEIIFLVRAKSSNDAIKMGKEFETQIRPSLAFESVAPLKAEEVFRSGLALYAPYRSLLLPEQTKLLLTTKGLPAGLQQSLSILQSPLSAFYGDFLTEDPLFNVPLFLQQSAPQNRNQVIDEGYLILKDETSFYFVLNARLKTSPFEKGTHDVLMPDIIKAEKTLKGKYSEFELIKSGLVFFAQRASVTAQNEITWLGSISMLGVLFLMLIVFRDYPQLLLSLLSISVGVIVALSVTLLIFPKIHLVTLTFGTSLIGISIDYSTHYFSDHLINKKNWSPSECIKRIGSGVTWGAFTTILAFIALAVNPLPGLHQIAVFSVAGIFGAYFTVMAAFPFFLTNATHQPAPYPFITRMLNVLYYYPQFIAKFKVVFCILFVMMIAGLFFVKTEDDVRSLQTPPQDLLNNEKLVHQMLDKIDPSRLIILRGKSAEELLQKEEQIKPLLLELIKNKSIAQYIATSQFLPSQLQQSKNYECLSKVISKKETVFTEDEKNILESTNFDDAYHTASEPAKLTPEIFYGSAFGKKFKNLLHQESEMPFSIILLQSVQSDKAIEDALKNQTDVFYINKTAQISATLKHMRELIALSTFLVYLLIYVLLAFQHGIKKSFAIIAVPAFSAMASILIVAACGQNIHISHTLAVIIVLGTGIDYTIFLAESPVQRNATTLAISLSAITTILSFGLLAFCQTEFLRAFGVTILIGVGLSYILAPLFFTNKKE